jgi:hypothetical protein
MKIQCSRCQTWLTYEDDNKYDLLRAIEAHIQSGECDRRTNAILQAKDVAMRAHYPQERG